MAEIAKLLPSSPFLQMLQIMVVHDDDGENNGPLLKLPYGENVGGRPGFLHGGIITTLMEEAGKAAARKALFNRGGDTQPRQINITANFMRAGLPEHLYASAAIIRMGRNMANIEAKAWQSGGPEKPIAMAQLHFMLK